MRKGTTESGFEFEINEQDLDDMEFLELLAKSQNDALAFPAVLEHLLGEKQKKALYDHIRDENGRVPVQATADIIAEIMTIAGEETKNS